MSAIDPRLEAYLTPAQAVKFCEEMVETIRLSLSAVNIRFLDFRRWGLPEKNRFEKWFGIDGPTARTRIEHGLGSMKMILESLGCENFLPLTDKIADELGCKGTKVEPLAVAAVCPIVGPVRIMLGKGYFSLDNTRPSGPTRPLVLLHELAHLPQVLSTRGVGETYTLFLAKMLAKTNPEEALRNSDNVAGYILDWE